MDESFFIPVHYKGREYQLEATLQRRGYLPAFHVSIEGTMVIFERDEEGSFRALIPSEEKGKVPDNGLLQAITEAIEEILK